MTGKHTIRVPDSGGFPPKWASVGFCARCARRAEPLYERFFRLPADWIPRPEGLETHIRSLSDAILTAETAAVAGHFPRGAAESARQHAIAAHDLAHRWFDTFYEYDTDGALVTIGRYYAATAGRTAHLVQMAIDAASDPSLCTSAQEMLVSMVDSISLTAEEKRLLPSIKTEYEEVMTVAEVDHWTDDSPFPFSFFALRSGFDTDADLQGRSIIEIGSTIQLRVLELLGDPQRVFRLAPREFEEVIAEVLGGFGFAVELTARTHDGGRDIVAINHQFVSQKFLVECKRYAPQKPVGIGVVQRLHGVTCAEGATKGIIVTTSRFTRSAEAFMERERWLLEGRDFDGLREWLEEYQKALIGRLLR